MVRRVLVREALGRRLTADPEAGALRFRETMSR